MNDAGRPPAERLAEPMAEVAKRLPELRDHELVWTQLFGGLAHVTYAVRTEAGDRHVVKFLTREMDDFGLMIPIDLLVGNTVAAGESGVGARVEACYPDLPAMVLEYIDGRTLDTADLARADLIPRIGRAARRLHTTSPAMGNDIDIFRFLEDYLGLVERHGLDTPEGLLAELPLVRRIQQALASNALPRVPSNNDLLAKNIMDDGEIRIIDYDFSGMNDPMFDVGDLAMEGDYDPDQVAVACEAYWGYHDPTQHARARLFGISAQYTWSLLFVGMDRLLTDSPDTSFDYWQEAVDRWDWTRRKLEDPDLPKVLEAAAG